MRTPSDFGTRAEPPSHPELLDWLAADVREQGWCLKKLHRTIVLSAAYQQAAGPLAANDPGEPLAARTAHRDGSTSRNFAIRCSRATGELDLGDRRTAGPLFSQPFTKRRTRLRRDRPRVPAGPVPHVRLREPGPAHAARSETTVPQQPLFFLNHPLPLERARALATK